MKDRIQEGDFADDWIEFYDTSIEPVDLLDEQRFVDEEFIAEGAVKKVYRVTDTHCAREVALASISPCGNEPLHCRRRRPCSIL